MEIRQCWWCADAPMLFSEAIEGHHSIPILHQRLGCLRILPCDNATGIGLVFPTFLLSVGIPHGTQRLFSCELVVPGSSSRLADSVDRATPKVILQDHPDS